MLLKFNRPVKKFACHLFYAKPIRICIDMLNDVVSHSYREKIDGNHFSRQDHGSIKRMRKTAVGKWAKYSFGSPTWNNKRDTLRKLLLFIVSRFKWLKASFIYNRCNVNSNGQGTIIFLLPTTNWHVHH